MLEYTQNGLSLYLCLKKKMHLSRLNSRVFSVELGNWQSKRLWNTDPFKWSVAEVQSKVILWEVSALQEGTFKKLYWIHTLGNYPWPLLLNVKLHVNFKSIGAWDSLRDIHCGGRFSVNSLWRYLHNLLCCLYWAVLQGPYLVHIFSLWQSKTHAILSLAYLFSQSYAVA